MSRMLFRTIVSSASGFFDTPMIKVIVGEYGDQPKTFFAHEGLLTARSLFFSRALNGNWKEALSKEVKLPDDDPQIFEIYLEAIYNQNLPMILDGVPSREYEILAKVYVLAEKLIDISTKAAIIPAILATSRRRSSPGCTPIEIIYRGTFANSPARRLFVDLYAEYTSANAHNSQPDALDLPREFLADLTGYLLARRDLPKTAWKNPYEQPEVYTERPKSFPTGR